MKHDSKPAVVYVTSAPILRTRLLDALHCSNFTWASWHLKSKALNCLFESVSSEARNKHQTITGTFWVHKGLVIWKAFPCPTIIMDKANRAPLRWRTFPAIWTYSVQPAALGTNQLHLYKKGHQLKASSQDQAWKMQQRSRAQISQKRMPGCIALSVL